MNFSLINCEYSVGHTMALKQTTNLSSSESFIQFRITCDNGVTGCRFLQLRAGNHGLCIGYFHFCLFVGLFVCFVVDVL